MSREINRRTHLILSPSWSPNSTDLYFWYWFFELAVVTPVERRNFVSVVPAAKKSNLGPIFFLNILVVYKLSVKKQETGQKTGKNPPKKVVFPAPPTSWPSLSSKVANFWGKSCQLLRQKLPSQLLRQKLPTFEDRPESLHNICRQHIMFSGLFNSPEWKMKWWATGPHNDMRQLTSMKITYHCIFWKLQAK